MSIRDRILSADDIESEIVDVPQWGVKIEVRSMDGRSRARMLSQASLDNGSVNLESVYPDMVILCSFDPDTGERIFEPGDADALMSKAAGPIEQVAMAAMRVSGMAADSMDKAGNDSSSTEKGDSSSS